MIKIGQKVIFDPLQYGVCYIPYSAPEYVVGNIIQVYNDHRWFLVEYPQHETLGNRTLRMGFKFDDFGFRGKHRHSVVIPVNSRREELVMRHFVYHGDLDKFYIAKKGR